MKNWIHRTSLNGGWYNTILLIDHMHIYTQRAHAHKNNYYWLWYIMYAWVHQAVDPTWWAKLLPSIDTHIHKHTHMHKENAKNSLYRTYFGAWTVVPSMYLQRAAFKRPSLYIASAQFLYRLGAVFRPPWRSFYIALAQFLYRAVFISPWRNVTSPWRANVASTSYGFLLDLHHDKILARSIFPSPTTTR